MYQGITTKSWELQVNTWKNESVHVLHTPLFTCDCACSLCTVYTQTECPCGACACCSGLLILKTCRVTQGCTRSVLWLSVVDHVYRRVPQRKSVRYIQVFCKKWPICIPDDPIFTYNVTIWMKKMPKNAIFIDKLYVEKKFLALLYGVQDCCQHPRSWNDRFYTPSKKPLFKWMKNHPNK